MSRTGLTRAGREFLVRSPSWSALPPVDPDDRWRISPVVEPMWPEYGGALHMLNALSEDGHDVQDLDGTLFERGRQVVVPHLAHVSTTEADRLLSRFVLGEGFHLDEATRDGACEAIIDEDWSDPWSPRRFRLVFSQQPPRLPRRRTGAIATTVGRLRREVPPLAAGPDDRFAVPAEGPFEEGWGRLAPVAMTLEQLGADVRPTFEGFGDLSGVVRFGGGTLVRGDLDWGGILPRFAFPAGVETEVLRDGYALVRDFPRPSDPLGATFALVLAPARRQSLVRRILT